MTRMINLHKRNFLQVAALTAVASAALVGCSKQETPAPAAPTSAASAASISASNALASVLLGALSSTKPRKPYSANDSHTQKSTAISAKLTR